jgi:hypothetical protein
MSYWAEGIEIPSVLFEQALLGLDGVFEQATRDTALEFDVRYGSSGLCEEATSARNVAPVTGSLGNGSNLLIRSTS